VQQHVIHLLFNFADQGVALTGSCFKIDIQFKDISAGVSLPGEGFKEPFDIVRVVNILAQLVCVCKERVYGGFCAVKDNVMASGEGWGIKGED